MNMVQNAAAGTIRSSLRYPAFRRLLSALATSQIGDWMYNLALVTLVYSRTHSAAWAGAATAARVVPIVVIGPLGGVLADRFSWRRIMIIAKHRPDGADAPHDARRREAPADRPRAGHRRGRDRHRRAVPAVRRGPHPARGRLLRPARRERGPVRRHSCRRHRRPGPRRRPAPVRLPGTRLPAERGHLRAVCAGGHVHSG